LLDQLEPIEVDSTSYRPRQALGYLPLLLALAISFGLAIHRLWQASPAMGSGAREGAA